jgi:hypothetical protein
MIIETFPAGILGCNCSVLGDEVTKEGIIVDPGGSVDKILSVVARHQLKLKPFCIPMLTMTILSGQKK